ncbi:MAG: sugar ABC transporter substrate-binding protein [Propionicimonas sp.]|nr:sugar ABC transporter substrate-binding protein [Propionicimonas sp.]MEA5053628.1 sugar ABC transporter substrate-binding protein [Propionicimonas sp.]
MKRSRIGKLGAITAVVLLASGIAGCSGTTSGEANGKVVLQMWTRGAGTEDLAARFNESQDKVEVQVTRISGDYATKVATAKSSGDLPDVMDIDDIDAPLYALNGVLTDITDRYESLSYKDDLNKAQVDLSTTNGRIYAIPNIAGPSIMMYNKDLFRKAGLDPEKPPSTWAELLEAAKAITALGDDTYGFSIPVACGGCIGYSFSPLIWASGGEIFEGEGADQHTTFSSAESAEAFGFYKSLLDAGVVNPAEYTEDGSTWGDWLASGKVGIELGTPVFYPTAIEAGVDVGTAPIPGKDGGFATFVGGDVLAIGEGTDHIEEAWQFIQFMLEPAQQEFVAEQGLVPTRLDMLDEDFRAKYPASATGLQAMENGHVPHTLAFNAIVNDANAPFGTAMEQILTEGVEPSVALAQLDQEATALIKQAATNAGIS